MFFVQFGGINSNSAASAVIISSITGVIFFELLFSVTFGGLKRAREIGFLFLFFWFTVLGSEVEIIKNTFESNFDVLQVFFGLGRVNKLPSFKHKISISSLPFSFLSDELLSTTSMAFCWGGK